LHKSEVKKVAIHEKCIQAFAQETVYVEDEGRFGGSQKYGF
jgi:hypothetical protein